MKIETIEEILLKQKEVKKKKNYYIKKGYRAKLSKAHKKNISLGMLKRKNKKKEEYNG